MKGSLKGGFFILLLLIIAIFLFLFYLLSGLKKKKKSFNFRVLTGLGLGIVFGGIINLFISDDALIDQVVTFMSIFALGYISLLKMIVIPLILVTITCAIMNTNGENSIFRITFKVIMTLMVTVAIAAIIGIFSVNLLNVDADKLLSISSDGSSVIQVCGTGSTDVDPTAANDTKNYAERLVSIIPTNIFHMLTGVEKSATISTVLFAMFLGYSVFQVRVRKPEKVMPFVNFMNALKEIIMSMIKEILKLTPFAVMSLMAIFMATNSLSTLMQMARFIVADYLAIFIMYFVHLLIIGLFGLNPAKFVSKSFKTLLFGFASRSSMATLPSTIETQRDLLGVDDETATISSTLGTSIGQNGCAGMYPAMLAFLTAQATGVDITPMWILTLVLVVTVTSFGVAGIEGGASIAAITVLSIMGLDIVLVGILMSIEPLIDMARTTINISGAMVSGIVVSKVNGTINEDVYNQ